MIHKKVLKNGLTILVRQTTMIPQVSIQLFYNVGSKHESSQQKGIAHLIEHMIFKGTKTLSESDINVIVHKLSGYCNAFTSYDYTGYIIDLPSAHWHEALPIMADCMRNCTFKQELLNSEMKAVIQELKMYNDNYPSLLLEKMISAMFVQHPYHYPIIGFKDNLWSMKQADLLDFYHKHYVPNNATLVIVGHVAPEKAFEQAQKYFESIEPNKNYKQEKFHNPLDIKNTAITLYRDVQQPHYAYAFLMPSAYEKKDASLDIIAWIIGEGKASRLYKKLVDELHYATSVEAFVEDLFDQSVLFLYIQPTQGTSIDTIRKIIIDEIDLLIKNGINATELIRAQKQAESTFLSLIESNQQQAYHIGKSYLATNDHEYLFNYIDKLRTTSSHEIVDLLKTYCRPSLLHSGAILPLTKPDALTWNALQEQIDQNDAQILKSIERNESVEEALHAHTIHKKKADSFSFPKPTRFKLTNGLTVLYYHNPTIDKIDIALSLKAKSYYDPDHREGLYNFISHMLLEGTKHYTKEQLISTLENCGMDIEINPGLLTIDCLSADLSKALKILSELVQHATFPPQAIEKIRKNLLTKLTLFWDDPQQLVKHLARTHIYHNHPYRKLPLGTQEALLAITQEDLINGYQQWFSPDQAVLVIVGNINHYSLEKLAHETFGSWSNQKIISPQFPPLMSPQKKHLHHFINRDQTTLAFAAPSISRKDPRFDALLLFDQILTGGSLGSMNSRLFSLREQSGLFYTIGGSLLYTADEQPGMIYISTLVSADRLSEAEKAINNLIDSSLHTINDAEIEQAQDMLTQILINNFETNKSIAQSFLFLEKYNLPSDYFDNRQQQLRSITKENIQQEGPAFISSAMLITIKAGRIKNENY